MQPDAEIVAVVISWRSPFEMPATSAVYTADDVIE
jgi:hypothetical protein